MKVLFKCYKYLLIGRFCCSWLCLMRPAVRACAELALLTSLPPPRNREPPALSRSTPERSARGTLASRTTKLPTADTARFVQDLAKKTPFPRTQGLRSCQQKVLDLDPPSESAAARPQRFQRAARLEPSIGLA